jgi:hypothetical protein
MKERKNKIKKKVLLDTFPKAIYFQSGEGAEH